MTMLADLKKHAEMWRTILQLRRKRAEQRALVLATRELASWLAQANAAQIRLYAQEQAQAKRISDLAQELALAEEEDPR